MMEIGVYLKEWGPLALFALVLAEQLGLPLPTLPVLLLAGALARQSGTWGGLELLAATAASLSGGLVWFLLGRRYSRRILRQLCRISLSPDFCVRQTELAFEQRGPYALIAARFVPGLSLLAPPLAGGLGMPLRTFALFQGSAALLYAGAGISGGLLFYEQLQGGLAWLAVHGQVALPAALGLLSLWLARKFWQRRKARLAPQIARIGVPELAAALRSVQPPLVLDVRSNLAREIDPRAVPTAQAFDWNDAAALAQLPTNRQIVTYCSCPNDVSALELARRILHSGRTSVQVLSGGLDSWAQTLPAAAPVEPALKPAAAGTSPTPG